MPIDEEPSDPQEGDVADRRMAEILAHPGETIASVRKRLQGEQSSESEDLLSRINALDYLDSLVGQVGGDLPDRLGDYRITGLLGRGGMGTVFEAFQESLERIVALKVLAPGMTADPKMRERFRAEARASATLHHQHIVPVYGFGEERGHLYFAMERVDGVSLDRHIRTARFRAQPYVEPREAARRFAGVADALFHAHRRGILHRDVKPANLLVHPDGSFALADFGLSKIVGQQLSVSGQGNFLGTLHYASPEQARGRPLTAASDLYGLGVTMYETLTGVLPFDAETTEGVLQAVLYARHEPLRAHLPKAPKDLEAVIGKLLEKEPEDRYQDGESLARDLLRVADDEPVRIRRQSLLRQVWRRARKHPALSVAIVTAAALLLVSFFLLWANIQEQRRSLVTRHENLLTLAMSTVEAEPGAVAGPEHVLEVLTGIPLPVDSGADPVLASLDDAARAMDGDPHTSELRIAYRSDPAPDATLELRLGHGHVARVRFDAHIAEVGRGRARATGDAVAWLREYRLDRLRLYRLHLGRAIACLSASVSDPESASKDLLRAAFVRPGAFLPAMLNALLDWSPADGVDALLAHLDRLVASGPPGADRATGSVLLAFAGLARPESANLMDFALRHRERRALHERALALLGDAWDASRSAVTAHAGPVETRLATIARAAAGEAADRLRVQAALAEGYEILDRIVAPGSRLQSWRLVFALLEDPASVAALADGSTLPADVQLDGWNDILELELHADHLSQFEGALRDLIGEHPELAETPRARAAMARLALRAGSPQRAFDAAREWIEVDPDSPDAYLCRVESAARLGQPLWVATAGYNALDRTHDRAAIGRRIGALLEEAARSTSEAALRAEWERLLRAFGKPER